MTHQAIEALREQVKALQRYACGPRGMIEVQVISGNGGWLRASDVESLLSALSGSGRQAQEKDKG